MLGKRVVIDGYRIGERACVKVSTTGLSSDSAQAVQSAVGAVSELLDKATDCTGSACCECGGKCDLCAALQHFCAKGSNEAALRCYKNEMYTDRYAFMRQLAHSIEGLIYGADELAQPGKFSLTVHYAPDFPNVLLEKVSCD